MKSSTTLVMKFTILCDDYSYLVERANQTVLDFLELDSDDVVPNIIYEIMVEEDENIDSEDRYVATVLAKVRDARA